MRKIYVVRLTVFAVVAFSAFSAFSAIVVASASALESGWLVGNATTGVGALTAQLVDTGEELTLDLLIGGILVIALKCSGLFDGTVGGEDEGVASIKWDLVTEVLNLSEKPVNAGNPLSCEVVTSAIEACGKVGELAAITPLNLPWLTEIILNGATFLDDFPATSGYHVTCPNGKGNECKGLLEAELTNGVTDVIGKLTEGNNEEACTEGVGHFIGEGLTLLISGETLSVSEGE
jgi:hypothetical protein